MDDRTVQALIIIGFAILVGSLGTIFKARCANCRKFFAMEHTGTITNWETEVCCNGCGHTVWETRVPFLRRLLPAVFWGGGGTAVLLLAVWFSPDSVGGRELRGDPVGELPYMAFLWAFLSVIYFCMHEIKRWWRFWWWQYRGG